MKKKWPFGFMDQLGNTHPPDWLRHVTPQWLMHLLFDRYHICYSGMVMWKMGYWVELEHKT